VILLANGNLMLIGGSTPATWEIDTPSGVMVSSGDLNDLRDSGSGAVKLANGNIFIFGASGQASGTWEIRDANGNFVSAGTLNTPEGGATGALQSNGNVFIAGGATFPNIWQIYSPTGALVATGGTWDNRAGGHSQNHF